MPTSLRNKYKHYLHNTSTNKIFMKKVTALCGVVFELMMGIKFIFGGI